MYIPADTDKLSYKDIIAVLYKTVTLAKYYITQNYNICIFSSMKKPEKSTNSQI